MKYLLTLVLICTTLNASTFGIAQSDFDFHEVVEDLEFLLDQAETRATPLALPILQTSRQMIKQEEIILGSCWDYIDAVFTRSGAPPKKRSTFFKSKFQGPYLGDASLIEPGDWLYYVNHSYNGGEHSGVFIEWTDYNLREALIMSYAGGNRKSPARYKKYIISHVYNIIRAK